MLYTERKKISTVVNQDGHVLDNLYAKSYQQFGKQILDVPLFDSFKTKIASILPQNYVGLDLGSSNCLESDQIMGRAATFGKKGKFISVDPLPTDQRTLEFTAEEYLSQSQPEKFDVILMKFVLHLIKDVNQILSMCHKCLKKNGVLVVVTLLKGTTLPWTQPLQKGWSAGFFDLVPIVNQAEFIIQSDYQWNFKKLQKKNLIGMIKNRGWSNLLSNTEEQINQCVQMLQNIQQRNMPNAKIGPYINYLRKIEK